ncbi:MAG: VWA domain-containing protein [Acidimicrobiia bacterium]|nr:VWA domain-containing protein [Acidimicrobiia bacterium]
MPTVTEVALFSGVDRAIFAAAFADRLRAAGVDVAFTGIERCVAALGVLGAFGHDELYWACRLSMIDTHRDIATFDALFDAVFVAADARRPAESRGQRGAATEGHDDDVLVRVPAMTDAPDATSGAGLPWATLPPVQASDLDQGDDDDAATEDGDLLTLPDRRSSGITALADRAFDSLDEAELERVGALLDSATAAWPERRSRRRRVTRSRGSISLARSVRRATQTGGDVLSLVHTEPRRTRRDLVVVLDVSGSMERYARAYLHLTRALAVHRRAEVFALSTELSRITPSVRLRSPAEAIEHAGDVVGDRFSGTRLASGLSTLLHHRVWHTAVRGSLVLICSDGWDSDEPADLERAMRRLALLAHRIVWVNPRAAAPGFEPLAAGMAAALPYCDHFLSGHSARSMADVVAALVAPDAGGSRPPVRSASGR